MPRITKTDKAFETFAGYTLWIYRVAIKLPSLKRRSSAECTHTAHVGVQPVYHHVQGVRELARDTHTNMSSCSQTTIKFHWQRVLDSARNIHVRDTFLAIKLPSQISRSRTCAGYTRWACRAAIRLSSVTRRSITCAGYTRCRWRGAISLPSQIRHLYIYLGGIHTLGMYNCTQNCITEWDFQICAEYASCLWRATIIEFSPISV